MQAINFSNVSFGKNVRNLTDFQNNLGLQDVMSHEEYDSFSKNLSSRVEEVLAENERRALINKKLDAKYKLKMIRAIQDTIDYMISMGETVPTNLVNMLKNLKK